MGIKRRRTKRNPSGYPSNTSIKKLSYPGLKIVRATKKSFKRGYGRGR